MPVYKAQILNKEIIVNYEESQKDILIESIELINNKLESYDNIEGKISDSKLLSFLAIKLQAEILQLKNKNEKVSNLEKKVNVSNNENIGLNDKIYKLSEQNEILKKENDMVNKELIKLQNQVETILKLVKMTYEE